MAFVGKLAYLVLFPGLLFILLAGLVARVVLAVMTGAATGGPPGAPAGGLGRFLRLFKEETIATGGALHAVQWSAPVVKLLALSWVSCVIFGFFQGDLVLLFALLLLASSADLVMIFCSGNPRVRQNGFGETGRVLGWAVPLALVLTGVALRTGEVTVTRIINWQVVNGVLIASASGGILAQVGTALGLAAALIGALCAARFRPLGGGLFDDPPGGVASDLSGAPLAMLYLSQTAVYFVFPLLVATLFFAGPRSSWYEVVFWALKVAGLVTIMGVVDMMSPRASSSRAVAWSLGAGGTLALAGIVLIWIGVQV